ncbi:site-specific integrase [Azonexus sp. R2A61]|uniref:tyrosine-type recombinase/integrase n=1 Tax=Azonexus sp. R2A61 TaxID=2744443 RepID=UPI001F2EC884|nr:site-specific integrase [Azonexus sp. R2A61]
MQLELPEPTDTLTTLLDAYCLTGGRDHRGMHRLKWTLDFWKSRYGETPVNQISRRDLSLHIESRRIQGKSNSTINREISILSAAINYAVRRWGWQINNPASGLYLKPPPGRLRWLSLTEATRLLAAARQSQAPHLHDFIVLAMNTGMRRSELLRLFPGQIDLFTKKILLEPEQTKNGKRRVIPLNNRAIGAIRSRIQFNQDNGITPTRLFMQKNGRPVVQINSAFKVAVDLAGVEDFRVHDLRHTFASWLVSSGVPLPEVRDLLGHSSIKETERYAHLQPGLLHKAVSVLDDMPCT